MQVTVDATKNRVTAIGAAATEHDAAGNLTKSDLNRYLYDAENRPTALKDLSGLNTLATYTYDGAGLRLKKVAGGTTTRYIFSGTKVIAEYDNGALPTAPTREYIYAGSQLLVTLSSTGVPTYHHPDHLSVRVNTDSAGTVVGQQGHYPFGESWYSINSTTKWQFTSYERDSESGLDYAMFRYDSSRLGRFLTPDPLGGSVQNPQSLNRYSYVINNPTNSIDPLGLYCALWLNFVVWRTDTGEIISWTQTCVQYVSEGGGPGGGPGGPGNGGGNPNTKTSPASKDKCDLDYEQCEKGAAAIRRNCKLKTGLFAAGVGLLAGAVTGGLASGVLTPAGGAIVGAAFGIEGGVGLYKLGEAGCEFDHTVTMKTCESDRTLCKGGVP